MAILLLGKLRKKSFHVHSIGMRIGTMIGADPPYRLNPF